MQVQQAPYGFADDYAQFFCRHSDAAYIKAQKIDVLKHLATHENQTLLVRELMEYTKALYLSFYDYVILSCTDVTCPEPSM